MNESFDRVLTERFALQHDELGEADFADVRQRARRLSGHRASPWALWHGVGVSWRSPARLALTTAAIAIAGGATALTVHALTQPPVTQGFSALSDSALPELTSTSPGVPSGVDNMLRDVIGPDYTARQVGVGMYLGERGGAVCEVVAGGAGQCTDHLDGDVWLFGDMIRTSDSEQSPFSVHLYGFARDDIAAVRVTSNGSATDLPVKDNAFQVTLADTRFGDITAIDAVSTSGETTAMDPRTYFPASAPVPSVPTP